MRTLSIVALLSGVAGSAHAHVADLPPSEHIAEHLLLWLALIPLVLVAIPLIRRLRRR